MVTNENLKDRAVDGVILSLRFDGKKINAEWLEMEKYLALNEKDVAR